MSMNASLCATTLRHSFASRGAFDRYEIGRPKSAFHGFFDAWLTLADPPEGERFATERAHHDRANSVAARARALVERGVALRALVETMASAIRGKAARFVGDDVYAGSWMPSSKGYASFNLDPALLLDFVDELGEGGGDVLRGASGRMLAAFLDAAQGLGVDDAYAELAVLGLAIRAAEGSETLADDAATAVRFFMLQEPIAHFEDGLTERGERFLQALEALPRRDG